MRETLLVLLLAGLIGLLTQACQAPAPPAPLACGTCEDNDRIIRLQPVDHRDGDPGFTHPFLLSTEDWKVILKSVHVQRQRQGFLFFATTEPVEPAFADDEIEFLGPRLSRVFRQAPPDARVAFALSRHPSPDITEITSGSWFVKGQFLHLVLANYRYAVTMATAREIMWQDPMWTKSGPFYDLVPGDHQTVQKEEGFARGFLTAALPSLSIEFKELLAAQSGFSPGAEKNQTPGELASPQIQTLPSHSSLEERLQTLKRLRDQGLITDEEYRSKKQ